MTMGNIKIQCFILALGLCCLALVGYSSGARLYSPDSSDIDDDFMVVIRQIWMHKFQSKLDSLGADLCKYSGLKYIKHLRVHNFVAFHVRGRLSKVRRLLRRTEIDFISRKQTMKVAIEDSDCRSLPLEDDKWGLARISRHDAIPVSNQPKWSYKWSYSMGNSDDGHGVTAYILDTGVRTDHVELIGRATWGLTTDGVKDEPETDMHGHGTHVSGIVAGTLYGVAKRANIVAIKVLNAEGVGSDLNVLQGIAWVLKEVELSKQRTGKHPKVVCNLSLGSPGASLPLEFAIRQALKAGVPFVLAAGNEGSEACKFTPARIAEETAAISVGSTDIDDNLSAFSNYGKCVDILAPGQSIWSAYALFRTAIARLDGTSMSAPFVTGAIARYLSYHDDIADPELIKSRILNTATSDKIDIPNNRDETPNRMLYVTCEGIVYNDLSVASHASKTTWTTVLILYLSAWYLLPMM